VLHYYQAKVLRIIDGDTLECMVDLGFKMHHRVTVRLLGVDAPETRTKDLAEKAMGLEVKGNLERFLDTHNNEVYIQTHKQGSFSRWLGQLWLDKDFILDINRLVQGWTDEVKESSILERNNKLSLPNVPTRGSK